MTEPRVSEGCEHIARVSDSDVRPTIVRARIVLPRLAPADSRRRGPIAGNRILAVGLAGATCKRSSRDRPWTSARRCCCRASSMRIATWITPAWPELVPPQKSFIDWITLMLACQGGVELHRLCRVLDCRRQNARAHGHDHGRRILRRCRSCCPDVWSATTSARDLFPGNDGRQESPSGARNSG